jgi:hypothetical protein
VPLLDGRIRPRGRPLSHAELLAKLSDLLLEYEGVDPGNESARHLTWVFVHRPEVYVAGGPPKTPRYRFICQVPEGQYNDVRRGGNRRDDPGGGGGGGRGLPASRISRRGLHLRGARRLVGRRKDHQSGGCGSLPMVAPCNRASRILHRRRSRHLALHLPQRAGAPARRRGLTTAAPERSRPKSRLGQRPRRRPRRNPRAPRAGRWRSSA